MNRIKNIRPGILVIPVLAAIRKSSKSSGIKIGHMRPKAHHGA